ncbi:MAG: tripartite tricarboxylate transporter substrate binding protein, partial [Janthinobacterium lividum]
GFDLVWPIMRGVYLGPEVPKEDVQRWRRLFDAMLADRRFAELRQAASLYPLSLTGAPLQDEIHRSVEQFMRQAREFGVSR